MSATISVNLGPSGTAFQGDDNTQRIHRVYVKVACAGNYAGAPGDPLDFTVLGDLLKSGYAPIWAEFNSSNPAGDSGYFYEYTPAANPTLSNGFFQVLRCGGANATLADLGAGAYPAGVTGDTIIGYVDFIRL